MSSAGEYTGLPFEAVASFETATTLGPEVAYIFFNNLGMALEGTVKLTWALADWPDE